MKILAVAALTAAVIMSACADPAANKPKAQTTAPITNVAANTNAAAKPAGESSSVLAGFKATGSELAVTPENSKVEFTGSKISGKHDGGFKTFKGIIDLVGEKPESSLVLIEIDVASVFTDADGLTKHLQTGDFFETEKFPKASFVSTKIEPQPGGNGNYNVTGDLEIRSVKKSVTFPATIRVTPEVVSVIAEFSINRKDFAIAYPGKADDLIRDDVIIRLELKPARVK